MTGRVWMLLATLGLMAPNLAAQQVQTDESNRQYPRISIPHVLGGVGGATLGLVAGGVLGHGLEDCSGPDPEGDSCGMAGAYVGGFLGSSLGSVIGVKVGGRLGGDPASLSGAALGALVGIVGGYALGWAVWETVDQHEVPFFIAFSVGQGAIAGTLAGLLRRNR